jgi:hypothetical protein
VCGTIVMFRTEQVLALTKTALALNTDVAKSTPVGAVLRHLRTASKYELLLQVSQCGFVVSITKASEENPVQS